MSLSQHRHLNHHRNNHQLSILCLDSGFSFEILCLDRVPYLIVRSIDFDTTNSRVAFDLNMSPLLLCPIDGGRRSESEGDSSSLDDSTYTYTYTYTYTCMFHESIVPSPSANPSPYAYSSPDRDCFAETKTKTHEHSSKPPKGQTTYRIGHGPTTTTIARRSGSGFGSIVVVWALLVSLLATTGSFLVEARPAAAASRILGIGNGRLQPKQSQSQSQSQPSIYTWGNFGHVPEPQPLASRVETKLRRLVGAYRDTIIARWTAFIEHHSSLSRCLALGLRCARTYVFWYFSEDCFVSIYEDRWHAERNPDAFFGSEGMWVSKGGHKDVVRKRIQRSKRNRQWVGLGYTPR